MSTQQDIISIKPHHFVDILRSLGSGKSTYEAHPYGHAQHIVAEHILRDRDVIFEIELGMDDICLPCKHNIDGICDDTIDTSFRPDAPSSKGEWNLMIDQRWCERLQLKPGDRTTARKLCELLRENTSDITDIYREVSAERIAERAHKLKEGIRIFLG